ncbi:hypothetical protein EDP2_3963 [Enterobacter cloacae S611]|uniref:Uncharacterized protein n=1 Tax=Enterobacter cloacae S611 TaxID=1399146 RepID=A0ABN0QBS0_ENTCL|nr:hypothetical protein EDP2_3963 [Enterobacter cloacae S611]
MFAHKTTVVVAENNAAAGGDDQSGFGHGFKCCRFAGAKTGPPLLLYDLRNGLLRLFLQPAIGIDKLEAL